MNRLRGLVSASVLALALAGCGDSAERVGTGSQSGTPSTEDNSAPSGKADSVFGNLPSVAPPTAKNIYALAEDRYPGTISFPTLLRQLETEAERRSVLHRFLNRLEQETGLEIKAPDYQTVFDQPEAFLDKLQFTMEQIDVGRKAALKIVADINPPNERDYQLPHVFDYAKAPQTTVTFPPNDPKEIAKGVYTGSIRNPKASDALIKNNTIFAEVIERLATNTKAEDVERFAVVYEGKKYESLKVFLEALVANGHEVTALVHHSVANFISLYATGPDGQRHSVAAPGFERTGVKDAQGNEAVLPFLHSEIVFSVRPGSRTEGLGIDASTAYFQGIPKTGFYCNECTDAHPWAGSLVSDTLKGADALKALVLAGYFTDIARSVAKKLDLAWDAYGATGVCNDSVAIVQQAVRGRVTSYPLLKLESYLQPEIDARIAEASVRPEGGVDAEHYQALQTALRKTPNDATLVDSARERALQSTPWESGKEPFASVIEARRILKGD